MFLIVSTLNHKIIVIVLTILFLGTKFGVIMDRSCSTEFHFSFTYEKMSIIQINVTESVQEKIAHECNGHETCVLKTDEVKCVGMAYWCMNSKLYLFNFFSNFQSSIQLFTDY